MLTTRRGLLAGGAATLALLAGCGLTGTGASSSTAANAQLGAAMDRIATNFLKLAPEACTSLAVTEAQAGGRYIDKLSDASKAGLEKIKQTLEQSVATLNGFNRDSLNHAGKDKSKSQNQGEPVMRAAESHQGVCRIRKAQKAADHLQVGIKNRLGRKRQVAKPGGSGK